MEDGRFELFMGLLGSATKSIQRLKNARMDEFDLSAAHTDCLCCLADAAPAGLTQTQLATRLGMDRAQISRVLRDLRARAYVRTGNDASGYKSPYCLTDAGRRIAAQIGEIIGEVRSFVSGSISGADIESFYRTFSVIAERLSQAVQLYSEPPAPVPASPLPEGEADHR